MHSLSGQQAITVQSRIWGIGLTRTGTTSLNRALTILGYQSVHWPTTKQLLYGNLHAATDESVAAVYKYLDLRWPGSKFILTERDEDSWIQSARAQRKRHHDRLRLAFSSSPVQAPEKDVLRRHMHRIMESRGWPDRVVELMLTQTTLYETLEFDEQKFRVGFRKHYSDVLRYFESRPRDLLRIRIADGNGWKDLCAFLERPIPDVPFPHENSTASHAVG